MRVSAAAMKHPLIKFLGKRSPPKELDHSPHLHPQDPHKELPMSFSQYRRSAQQHGPLGQKTAPSVPFSSRSSTSSSSPQTPAGEYIDRNQLPPKFHRLPPTEEEMEAVQSGFYIA